MDSLTFWNDVFAEGEYEKEELSNWSLECEQAENMVIDLAKQDRILDMGCGDGWMSFYLLQRGASHVTGIDMSQKAIDGAKTIAKNAGLTEKTRFIQGNEKSLEALKEQLFDGFFSCNLFDVVPETVCKDILQEVKKVLIPGAKGYIFLNPYMTKEEFEKREAKEIVENGVVVKNHYAINGILRVVNKTSEEWKTFFNQYFKCTFVGDIHFGFEPEDYLRRAFMIEQK